MDTLKLLIVEDDEKELAICESSRKRYQRQYDRQIEIVACKTLSEALKILDNTFDGAIVDLKLNTVNDDYEGNVVVKEIRDSYRIPVAILTGTPQNAEVENSYLGVYTRGEVEFVELFDLFYLVFDTGLTKIFGGRGVIERAMDNIFWNSILPVFEDWKTYVSEGKDTEKALLRFAVNHLLELLDIDSDIYYPEEMYMKPQDFTKVRTGNIVQEKETDDYFIVLSPACDLVVRKNGEFKTDSVLVCFIEKRDIEIIKSAQQILNPAIGEDGVVRKTPTRKQKDQAARELKKLAQNNSTNYYHYLPKTHLFNGGIINFRKVNTFHPSEFNKRFSKPVTRISMAFTKDIVARFSSFYARQGQPDFDSDALVDDLKNAKQ